MCVAALTLKYNIIKIIKYYFTIYRNFLKNFLYPGFILNFKFYFLGREFLSEIFVFAYW